MYGVDLLTVYLELALVFLLVTAGANEFVEFVSILTMNGMVPS